MKKKCKLDDGKNRRIQLFYASPRCKRCKMSLGKNAVSLVDDRYCRYCVPVKDVEEL